MAETSALFFSTFSSRTTSPVRHSPSAARFSSLFPRLQSIRFAVKSSYYGSFSDEDTVLEHGEEVVATEKESTSGLQEKLTMTVAVGVPPAAEWLHLAVRTGGGIVDKVYWQWDFL